VSEIERDARIQRLAALREAGVDPYPARVGEHQPVSELRARWDDADAEQLEREKPRAAVCGRIMALKSFGKLLFLQLHEAGHAIQVSARKQNLEAEDFAFVKALHVGDIVRVEGTVWRTKTDELTVDAESVTLLSKSLRPLPEKWHGLQDVETRFRQRYLDLLVNPESREAAVVRSRTVTEMRTFLDGRGFLEVETPILQPLYGGATARPFTTHHNAYDEQLFLRISDELYLKRLVIGGLDRVYEIGRNFRNEGVSRKHNPEFTLMECYQAYADYHDMMELVQAMVQEIASRVRGGLSIEYQGTPLELGGEWPRLPMCEALAERTGIDVLGTASVEELREAVRGKGLDPGDAPTWGLLVDDLFSDHVEPSLVQPTFVTDYPVELSPLAKRSVADPRLVERFELFLAGFEVANAFSELNDPLDQRERFEAEGRNARDGDDEAHPLDEDFLAALEHGLPPTGGLGVGVDRIAMVMADVPSLREILLFPHMRGS